MQMQLKYTFEEAHKALEELMRERYIDPREVVVVIEMPKPQDPMECEDSMVACEVSMAAYTEMETAARERNLIRCMKQLRTCVPMSLLAAKRIVEAIKYGTEDRFQERQD